MRGTCGSRCRDAVRRGFRAVTRAARLRLARVNGALIVNGASCCAALYCRKTARRSASSATWGDERAGPRNNSRIVASAGARADRN